MKVVLDTSVAVAWYLDETGCEAARKWQAECLAGHIDVLVAITQDALLVTAERATTPWVRKLGRQAVVISSP